MKITRRLAIGGTLAGALLASTAAVAQDDPVRIALVVKSLGNGFFEAAHRGAEEAAEELGNVEIIYTGPTDTTAEGQIEVINSLIAQDVDAIAVSANDPDALVPALKRAMQRGDHGDLLGLGRGARGAGDAPFAVVARADRADDHQARG